MFTITDKAVTELKSILNGPDMPLEPAIRVFAQSAGGGCCSGNQLGIEVADLAKTETTSEDFNGLKVVMDNDAREIAQNATIDFYDHADNPGFRVLWQKSHHHGHEGGGCGCH